MRTRLAYLLLALLSGLAGAGLELIAVAATRPWTPPLFWRTAAELALLWSGAALGVALLRLATRRAPAPAGALLCGPIGWTVAWFLTRLDGGGRLDTGLVALVGALLTGALLLAHGRLDGLFARLKLLARPLLWVVVAPLLLGGALLRQRARTPAPPERAAAAGAKSVLWISLDTLRADRLGCYGNASGLSPHLDALARESVLFEQLTCPMPLTAPSHTAMLTGLPPHESGVTKNGQPLPHDAPTLPRRFAGEGYATGGFVSGFPLFQRSSHYADHFHWYDDEFDPKAPLGEGGRSSPLGTVALRALRKQLRWKEPIERAGDVTVGRALEWLARDEVAARPFFLFVHLYDVHGEYVPHEPGVARSRFWDLGATRERLAYLDDPQNREHLARLYDGEVKWVDAQVERLFAQLRATKRWDDTLVVVTSDHGESLGEHDYWYEHINPYHVETHCPAIVKLPGGAAAGTRVSGPAQTLDLAKTVVELVGAPFEVEGPGASLVGAIESGRIPRRTILCQSMFDFGNTFFAVSAWDGRYKLLYRSPAFQRHDSKRLPASEELFDVLADPGETVDLLKSGALPDDLDLEALRNELDAYFEKCLAVGPAHVADDVAEQLKQLGYGNK
ncbi:MAG: sulfatase [Planctomycetes bacterium]|nr:sulfatase [Planctomycetota bacterium]